MTTHDTPRTPRTPQLPRTPRLLLLEDNSDTAQLIVETLNDHFASPCVKVCYDIASALEEDVDQIDLILSDMNLPDGTGLDFLRQTLAKRPDIPVVLVTAEGILENALIAIREGAYDYVVKAGDYLFAIPVVVEKNLAIWQTKKENLRLESELTQTLNQVNIKNKLLEEAVQKLATAAATDPLTGLANRRALGDAMDRSFAQAYRYEQDLVCIMIDLDGFKKLNDTLGHGAGDDMLEKTARVLEANCRQSDVAGRFGGDEFVIVLPQTDMPTAVRVAKRICQEYDLAAQQVLGEDQEKIHTAMSIGLASQNQTQSANPQQLMAMADQALYAAKQGSTSIVVYDPHLKDKTIARQNG